VVVRSFVNLTEFFAVPELVASAIVLALGTSLPELVVDLTAIRHGAASLAIGDLFGSSLVDATLALGSGPAIRATVVSSDAVLTCVIAAAGVAAASVITARRSEHGLASAVLLFAAYVGATAGFVVWTS
jgi:cation:H+ antiporter